MAEARCQAKQDTIPNKQPSFFWGHKQAKLQGAPQILLSNATGPAAH